MILLPHLAIGFYVPYTWSFTQTSHVNTSKISENICENITIFFILFNYFIKHWKINFGKILTVYAKTNTVSQTLSGFAKTQKFSKVKHYNLISKTICSILQRSMYIQITILSLTSKTAYMLMLQASGGSLNLQTSTLPIIISLIHRML